MTCREFIFTISTGRSGTAYLAELVKKNLNGSEAHHEISGFDKFGIDTPDLSHLTLFNSQGNIPRVQDFWRQKFQRVVNAKTKIYCETSHLLAKAGLIENLEILEQQGHVHVIILDRDAYSILKSFVLRQDFVSPGHSMMWYLTPRYPKNILKLGDPENLISTMAWYIAEMRCRASYYKEFLSDRHGVTVHECSIESVAKPDGAIPLLSELKPDFDSDDISIPDPANTTRSSFRKLSEREHDALKNAAARIDQMNTDDIGKSAYRRGFRF